MLLSFAKEYVISHPFLFHKKPEQVAGESAFLGFHLFSFKSSLSRKIYL